MSSLQGRKIALLGGAGFIGHNLALVLKEQGAEVAIVDSLQVNNLLAFQESNPAIVNRKLYTRILHDRLELLNQADIPLYVQDVRDYHTLCKYLNRIRPDTIIHLAAVSHAGQSNKDPYNTFDHSLRTLENALDGSRTDYVKHFVYFSSSMVYGEFGGGTVNEESPCNPLGIYGALKLSGELMVKAYHQVFKLPYTIVRPSALYGERCVSRRVGQIFIENAFQGAEITVQGDGSERLDFTYIQDLCAGVVAILTHDAAKNETFNLTYGDSRSIADMLALLRHDFPDIKVNHADWDKLIPKRGTLCMAKAKRLLGFTPSWPLERGFPEYIKWYRSLYAKA
jgi:nucleoside-diphosphate-sugar epimerase